MANNKKIGEKIKKARKDKKLTQKQLAYKVGVTWEMISRYERGLNNPISKISKISNILDKSTDFFIQEPKNEQINIKDKNFVPLFYFPNEIQDFINKKVYTSFYLIPLWLRDFQDVLAINLENCYTLIESLKGTGVLYITKRDYIKTQNPIVVIDQNNKFIIQYKKQVLKSEQILGYAIAIEKRFL